MLLGILLLSLGWLGWPEGSQLAGNSLGSTPPRASKGVWWRTYLPAGFIQGHQLLLWAHLGRYRSSAASRNTGLTSDNTILSSYLLQILQCSASQQREVSVANELCVDSTWVFRRGDRNTRTKLKAAEFSIQSQLLPKFHVIFQLLLS